MNQLEAYYVNGPYDITEECARFAIDEVPGRYVLAGVTKAGDTYTLSFWAKSDAAGVIYVGGNAIDVSTSWKKHRIVITASETDVSVVFAKPGAYLLCRMKLEEGNKPTDWSPAPEDYSTTEQMKSEIKLQIDSITLSVEDSSNGYAVIKLATGEGSTQEKNLPDVRKMFADSNSSAEISAGTVTFNAGTLVINSENLQLNEEGNVSIAGKITASEGSIAGWTIDDNSIRHGNLGADGSMWLCRTGTSVSPSTYGNSGIAGTAATQTGWCITVGNKFGVLKSGAAYMSDLHVTGGSVKIKSIDNNGEVSYTAIGESGLACTSDDYSEGERGCAMKYGSQIIQCEIDGNTIPMILVGYYEDTGQTEKVLAGRWVIEDIQSPTINNLTRRIEAIEENLGL